MNAWVVRYGKERTFAAVGALAVGMLLCMHRQHFVLDVVHPLSFKALAVHRCGMVMAGAMPWVAAEVSRLSVSEPTGTPRG